MSVIKNETSDFRGWKTQNKITRTKYENRGIYQGPKPYLSPLNLRFWKNKIILIN